LKEAHKSKTVDTVQHFRVNALLELFVSTVFYNNKYGIFDTELSLTRDANIETYSTSANRNASPQTNKKVNIQSLMYVMLLYSIVEGKQWGATLACGVLYRKFFQKIRGFLKLHYRSL